MADKNKSIGDALSALEKEEKDNNLSARLNEIESWLGIPVLLNNWFKYDNWTLDQAALLLIGVDPVHTLIGQYETHLGEMHPYFVALTTLDDFERDPRSHIHGNGYKLNQLLNIHSIWESGNHLPGEKYPPIYFVKWALSKGFEISWLGYAIDQGLLPANVGESSEPDAVTAAKGTPVKGITKQRVIGAFEGLYFDTDAGWGNALSDVPQWIEPCRLMKGKRGDKSMSALWDPVLIAVALLDKGVPIKKLDAVFVRLNDWADEWREASASFRD